jgi:tetratricopeptide (TPR) repeat protein
MKTKISFLITTLLFVFTSLSANAQITDNDLIKSHSEKACKCIDSIDVAYKPQKIVAKDISKCIDKQVSMYQLLSLMTNATKKIDSLDKTKDTIKKPINMAIEGKGSENYNKYYYKLERYLMENCPAIKKAVASDEKYTELGISQNDKAREYYSKGQDADEVNNYKKAIKFYKKAVKIDPNFAFAYDNLGVVYRKTKQYDKALEAYAKSIKIIPTNSTPIMNSAVVYIHQRKYDKAIEMYQKLIEIDDTDPESFYGIGHAQTLKGDYEEALDNICKAYNLYYSTNSPYRSDAEKMINLLYRQLKKEGKEDKFNEILKKNKINPN